MGQKSSHKSGYEWIQYFGMVSPPVSLTKEQATTFWNEIDEKKRGFVDRVKDDEKIQKMFQKVGALFLELHMAVNQTALETAKVKHVPNNKARELRKFERIVEKAKIAIVKDYVNPSSIAHCLRAAKVTPQGKIFKDKLIVTLVEGGQLEAKGMRWANFNKYNGPDPRISQKSAQRETKGETKQRVLSSEEQLRRSKFQMAHKSEKPRLSDKESKEAMALKKQALFQERLQGFKENKIRYTSSDSEKSQFSQSSGVLEPSAMEKSRNDYETPIKSHESMETPIKSESALLLSPESPSVIDPITEISLTPTPSTASTNL